MSHTAEVDDISSGSSAMPRESVSSSKKVRICNLIDCGLALGHDGPCGMPVLTSRRRPQRP